LQRLIEENRKMKQMIEERNLVLTKANANLSCLNVIEGINEAAVKMEEVSFVHLPPSCTDLSSQSSFRFLEHSPPLNITNQSDCLIISPNINVVANSPLQTISKTIIPENDTLCFECSSLFFFNE
jgi:hypothetical protein